MLSLSGNTADHLLSASGASFWSEPYSAATRTDGLSCHGVQPVSLHLEGLEPADIMEAQERDAAKLPTLKGSNLADGPQSATSSRTPTRSQGGASRSSFRTLHGENLKGTNEPRQTSGPRQTGEPFARRQIAGAYALRALDFLECRRSRVSDSADRNSCSATPARIRRSPLHRYHRCGSSISVIYRSCSSRQPGMPAIYSLDNEDRTSRPPPCRSGRPSSNCVPKADLTLALGHLTMHSADLHRLPDGLRFRRIPNTSFRTCGATPTT